MESAMVLKKASRIGEHKHVDKEKWETLKRITKSRPRPIKRKTESKWIVPGN